MNILITGGAGFIGSHIADKYIEAGHNVIVVDNLSHGDTKNLNKNCRFYRDDISAYLDNIFEENKIDVINHHAAQIDLRKSQADPISDVKINIEAGISLMNTAVKYKVKKIIFASSGGAVYGEQKVFPADESHVTEPLSPYGIDKLAFEKYLKFYKEYYGIEYVILRYANVYGPRQSLKGEGGVVSVFTKKIIRNETPVINGRGDQTRDYVFVDDVASANLSALEYNQSGIFNIATGKETSVNELYEMISECSVRQVEAAHAQEIRGEQKRSVLDARKAKEELNWQAKTDIRNGIKITFDWFRDNIDRI